MRQWMLRITAYAQRLIDELEGLDWPESIRALQRNSSRSNSRTRISRGKGGFSSNDLPLPVSGEAPPTWDQRRLLFEFSPPFLAKFPNNER